MPPGLICAVCPGRVTNVRNPPPGPTVVTVWLPSMVWLRVMLLSGEKFNTLPEPRMPIVAVAVFILNRSLFKLAIAPVNARNVPLTSEKTLMPDSSDLPTNWYCSILSSVSARTAMNAPSLMRSCAMLSAPLTTDSPASISPPRTA